MSTHDDSAPGWDAITARVETFYPTEPVQYGMNPGIGLGSPLQGLSAYRGGSWWFLVTYGLTELFQKESDEAAVSGWGYEFTMRAPLTANPPD